MFTKKTISLNKLHIFMVKLQGFYIDIAHGYYLRKKDF